MSDSEGEEKPHIPYVVEYAKSGRAGCKACKGKIATGELRFGSVSSGEGGGFAATFWRHAYCVTDAISKQVKVKLGSGEEVGGYATLKEADQAVFLRVVAGEEDAKSELKAKGASFAAADAAKVAEADALKAIKAARKEAKEAGKPLPPLPKKAKAEGAVKKKPAKKRKAKSESDEDSAEDSE